MCSELFRIPLDWLNTPVMGSVSVGMLMALAIGVGIVKLLAWGRKTKRSAEAWAYVPGMVILAVVLALLPRLITGIPIRGYGVMVLLGSLTGVGMAAYRARQQGLSPEIIYALAFAMFICGIIGARLFFVIEYWETRFQLGDWRSTLLEVVKFTEGGLVVYGALIGATVAFVVFAVRHHLPPLALADLIAPSLLTGLAFGRIGCLLNGCCYGGESSQLWAVTFPRDSMPYMEQVVSGRMFGFTITESPNKSRHPVIASVAENSTAGEALEVGMAIERINGKQIMNLEQAHDALFATFSAGKPLLLEFPTGKSVEIAAAAAPARSYPVHPTQIYSAVQAALLSWVLWSYYPFRRRDGEVTALMLTIYPVARFLLEMIRIDESAVFGTGLSISQNISVVLFMAAIALWIYLLRQKPHVWEFRAAT